jgi:CRP-like cAMP-binding protein
VRFISKTAKFQLRTEGTGIMKQFKKNMGAVNVDSNFSHFVEDAFDGRTGIHGMSRANRQINSRGPYPFNGLLANKLLTALPGADFARLLPYLEPVSLVTGQFIGQSGEDINYSYFPETAVISHICILEDGGTAASAIVGKDGMTGLWAVLDSRPPSHWTQVTIGGTAIRVRSDVLAKEFALSTGMQEILLAYAGERLTQLSQRAACNARHKLAERLCTWLLMIHDRASEEKLPLTHEEIARQLGTRRAGITTTCNSLRDSGIIDYRRGMICILDPKRLEAAACQCRRDQEVRPKQREAPGDAGSIQL